MKRLLLVLMLVLPVTGCALIQGVGTDDVPEGSVVFEAERNGDEVTGRVCANNENATEVNMIFDSNHVSEVFSYPLIVAGTCTAPETVISPSPVACQATGFWDGIAFRINCA